MGTQKHNEVVKMDARKFVRFINNSASSKIAFFENAVRKMGAENDKNWKFVAIDGSTLMFEDMNSNVYYTTNVSKDGNSFTIDKITKVSVIEEEKSGLFNENCKALVESICDGKINDADKTYKKLEAQRFRSKVIPEHGYVTTKDGITRKIVTSKTHLKENSIPKIVKALAAQLKDSVELSEGRVVKAIFRDNSEFKLPINEYTRRQSMAKTIKEAAKNACNSESFCKFIKSVAGLISEGKVVESVKAASKFLVEEQEFTVLTLPEMVTLVENSLASCGVFSSDLAFKTATLLHKTNLKVNKNDIIESWAKAAKMAQSAALLGNVQLLSETANFEKDHADFMHQIFCESASVTKAKADLYRLGLDAACKALEHTDGNEEAVDSLKELVKDLESPEIDEATLDDALKIWMGLDKELIDDLTSLEDFDEIPGEDEGDDVGSEEDSGEIIPLPETPDEGAMEGPPAATNPMQPDGNNPPLMAGKDEKGNVIAESSIVLIENMNKAQLSDELNAWKVNGHIWLKEDGFDDCFSQMGRYIARCEDINSPLKKEFDIIRSGMLEDDLGVSLDEAHDPYAKSLGESFKFADSPQSSDSRMDELQTGKTVVDKGAGKTDGRKGDKTNSGAVEGNPRMDELQTGKTVVGKEVGKTDGRKGDKTNSGAVEGNPRMDELQTGKTVVPSKVGKTDGRSANTTAVEEEVNSWFSKDPNGSKKATSMRDSDVGGGKTVVDGKPSKMKDAADVNAKTPSGAPERKGDEGELQGSKSVVEKGFKTTSGAKGEKAASGAAKTPPGGTSMMDPETTGGSKPVVKGTTEKVEGEFGGNIATESMDPIDRIASLIEGNDFIDKKIAEKNGADGAKPAKDGAKPAKDGAKPAAKRTNCAKCGIGKDCACTKDECFRPNKATQKNSKGRVKGAGVKAPPVSEDVSIDITTPKGTNVKLSSSDEQMGAVIQHVLDAMEGSGDSDILSGVDSDPLATDSLDSDVVGLDTEPAGDSISEPIDTAGEADLEPTPEIGEITGSDMDFGDGESEGIADLDGDSEEKSKDSEEESEESDDSEEKSEDDSEEESEESDDSEEKSEDSEESDDSEEKSGNPFVKKGKDSKDDE